LVRAVKGIHPFIGFDHYQFVIIIIW